jgi:nucleoside-diphosphate-sugar epimerase
MKFNYKKVYITGSNGWLGRQLTKSFFVDDQDIIIFEKHSDLRVECLILENEEDTFFSSISPEINIVRGDVTNKSSCKNFLKYGTNEDILIHTAGLIHPKNTKDFARVNVQGTLNVVNEAIEKKIQKIIVISSNSPCGNNKTNQDVFDEQSPYNPYMGYGKSKMQMEIELSKKISEGHDITIIRPPWFYGEEMPDRQLTFYNMIIAGRFPFIGDGTNIRSVANVKNIVQGIILASIKPESKGQTYWIADNKNLSMNEIVQTIQDVFVEEFNIKCIDNKLHLPYFIGQIAQAVDWLLQSFGLYHQKFHVLSEMNKNIACDISKAQAELGYSPKVNYYEGTKNAYKQYLNINESNDA